MSALKRPQVTDPKPDAALVEAVLEAVKGHRHLRIAGGHVACSCGEPWDDHRAHVAEQVVLAVRKSGGPDPATASHEALAREVRAVSDLIDSTYPAGLDTEAHLMRRVFKVSEEVGEVTEALFGAVGENPRKGFTHSMNDVRKELFDVALAALAAVAHFDTRDPVVGLEAHAAWVHSRLAQAVTGSALTPPPDTETQ